MKRSTAAALGAVVLGAVAIRLSPLWSFLYWGSDAGEYFAILQALVRTGHVSTTYDGWGITYPFFPGAFFPQAGLAELGGVDVPTVLNLLLPMLGGLGVMPMFLLGVRIAKEPRFALFAAAFLAGAMPHVYTTAHSAPATLGDLLLLANLLLFLRLRTDPRALGPLLLGSAALIVTHHLSLYFLLLMVLGAVVIRGLVRPSAADAGVRREVMFLGLLIAGAFTYWFGYATTFRDSILTDVTIRPWWILFVGFAVGLAALAGLILLRRRIPWRYRPRVAGFHRLSASVAVATGTLFAIGVITVLWGVPGTTVRVPPDGLLFFVPLTLLMSLSAAGRKFLDFERDGMHPSAWLIALLLSALVGIAFAPRVLIPYRHPEFLMIPFAIFAGVGFFRLLHLSGWSARKRAIALAASGALLVANGLAGIPPPSTFAGWREGTDPIAIDPAYWARDYVSGLLVADHHASTTAFGFGGVDATWDRTSIPFASACVDIRCEELRAIRSPSGIRDGSYVWIDRDTEAGVRLQPWDPAVPMDPTVLAKLDSAPFIKVFDNGYARIYWIAWGCDASC